MSTGVKPKEKIKDKYGRIKREKQEMLNQLIGGMKQTQDNPGQTYQGNRFQRIKNNAQQAGRDIRNGHADWHEPWWENDTTALGKTLKNYKRRKGK